MSANFCTERPRERTAGTTVPIAAIRAARPNQSQPSPKPVSGSEEGNVARRSSGDVVVVAGKTTPKSVGDVVVGATTVVVGATVLVVAATVVVGTTVVVAAIVVVEPATVVVDPTTVVVVGGRVVVVGGSVVVVVSTTVVVVVGGNVVVVVGGSVVVVDSGTVVVVVGGAVVVVTGGATTELDIARSSFPALQFDLFEHVKSSSRMWYGEPSMEAADMPVPQSAWLATWPDHDSTAKSDEAVNHTVTDAELVSV